MVSLNEINQTDESKGELKEEKKSEKLSNGKICLIVFLSLVLIIIVIIAIVFTFYYNPINVDNTIIRMESANKESLFVFSGLDFNVPNYISVYRPKLKLGAERRRGAGAREALGVIEVGDSDKIIHLNKYTANSTGPNSTGPIKDYYEFIIYNYVTMEILETHSLYSCKKVTLPKNGKYIILCLTTEIPNISEGYHNINMYISKDGNDVKVENKESVNNDIMIIRNEIIQKFQEFDFLKEYEMIYKEHKLIKSFKTWNILLPVKTDQLVVLLLNSFNGYRYTIKYKISDEEYNKTFYDSENMIETIEILEDGNLEIEVTSFNDINFENCHKILIFE